MTGAWVFLGFGEAAAVLAAGLRARRNPPPIAACLPLGRPPSRATQARLAAAGIPCDFTPAGARGARVVLSLVTPTAAREAAAAVAPHLAPGALFVDLNSIAGDTVREIASVVAAGGAEFVDAAILAPVPLRGLQVPLMVSGTAAETFHRLGRRHGLNTRVLSPRPGDASDMKMLWSIITKGTIALFAESLVAAQRLDLLDPMTRLLAQEYGRTGSSAMVMRMLHSTVRSGARRLDEMEEARRTLDRARVPDWTIESTRRWIAALCALPTLEGTSVPASVRELSAALEAAGALGRLRPA